MKNKIADIIANNFFVLIAFYAMSVFLSNDMYLPAIPDIAKDFGVSSGDIQMAMMWWLIGSIVVGLFIGPVSDMYGRKRPMLICGISSFIGTLICGFSTDPNILFFGRFFEGTAAGAIGSVGIASIIEYYHGERSVRALSIAANIMIFAPMLGPILGAAIMYFFHWYAVFFVDDIFYAMILILMFFFMPETLPPEKRHKSESLLAPIHLMLHVGKDPVFLGYCLSTGLTRVTFMFWIAGAPIMLMENLGLDKNEYALWQIPAILAYVLGNFIITAIIHKVKLRNLIINTHIIYGVNAIIALCIAYFFDDIGLYLLLGACVLLFLPIGLLNSPKTKYVITIPAEHRGTASTFYSILSSILNAVGVVFVVHLHGSSISVMLSYMAFFSILAVIVAFVSEYFLTRRHNLLGLDHHS